MREFMTLAKALADENRVRMLLALNQGELCVCRITELFGLSPSTTSKHLSILYQAGLVNTRKEGRWIYYTLAGKEASALVQATICWAQNGLRDNAVIAEDAARLAEVLKADASELCKRQCRK